ncbi:MAG: VTT domain-containing protein [Propionibacteriaceae bacterium]|nr:VTT domain-containing protein [Propionibacteriaceae bacterium]
MRRKQALTKNAFNAMLSGRLIPGGRTPVIIALGLSQCSLWRFMLFDTVACALWAGIYSSLGSIGGRIVNHPIWAMVIAIAFATSIGVLVQKIRSWLASRAEQKQQARSTKRSDAATGGDCARPQRSVDGRAPTSRHPPSDRRRSCVGRSAQRSAAEP